MADKTAAIIGAAVHAVSTVGKGFFCLQDRGDQWLVQGFICIQANHIMMAGQLEGQILLAYITPEFFKIYLGTLSAGYFHRSVVGIGIQDNDLIGHFSERFDTTPDIGFFIKGNYDGG